MDIPENSHGYTLISSWRNLDFLKDTFEYLHGHTYLNSHMDAPG
jgi:hypothetical protein